MDPIDIINTIHTSQDTIIAVFDNENIATRAYNEIKNNFSYKHSTLSLANKTIEMENFHSYLFLLNLLNILKRKYGARLYLN